MIFVVAQKLSGIAVADLGEGPVRPAPSYFKPKLRPEGPKKFLETAFPPQPDMDIDMVREGTTKWAVPGKILEV